MVGYSLSWFRTRCNIPLTFDVNLLREFFSIPNATIKELHEPPSRLHATPNINKQYPYCSGS